MNFYRSKALHYILFRLHIISFNDYCKSVKKNFFRDRGGYSDCFCYRYWVQ